HALRRRAAHQDAEDERQRDERAVVEVLAAAELSLRCRNADDVELVAADPDGLPDRVASGEETGRGNRAQHDHAAAEATIGLREKTDARHWRVVDVGEARE